MLKTFSLKQVASVNGLKVKNSLLKQLSKGSLMDQQLKHLQGKLVGLSKLTH